MTDDDPRVQRARVFPETPIPHEANPHKVQVDELAERAAEAETWPTYVPCAHRNVFSQGGWTKDGHKFSCGDCGQDLEADQCRRGQP